MNQRRHKTLPEEKVRPYLEEADIGSGEKTPAQMETEEMIRQIPPLPPSGQQSDASAQRQGAGNHPAKPQGR